MNDFSVALGLVDYFNVLFTGLFYYVLLKNIKPNIDKFLYWVIMIGAMLTVFFSFCIPTYKVSIGIEHYEYETPYGILFMTYLGFLISGVGMFIAVFFRNKNKKLEVLSGAPLAVYQNAVFLAMLGKVLMYACIIKMAIKRKKWSSLILYAFSLVLIFIMCYIANFGTIPVAWAHWIVEIVNITCQVALFFGTVILFKERKH
ncbi:MAG: hypothetical protein Q4E88_04630 [Coriobacteriia bacterium]|nr:hypothetical protein [Coriobacteriia bacterium]